MAQYNTGKIQDCRVTGTVTGHMGSTSSMSHPAFGGIVGENEVAGTISGCSSGVNISISMTATDSYVGGIAGVNIGTIENVLQEEIFLSHRLTEILIRFTLEVLPAGSNSLETWADM